MKRTNKNTPIEEITDNALEKRFFRLANTQLAATRRAFRKLPRKNKEEAYKRLLENQTI